MRPRAAIFREQLTAHPTDVVLPRNAPRVEGAHALGQAKRNGLALRCECGWDCALDNGIIALARHTVTAHKRQPTGEERTPRTAPTETDQP